jgi:hypothetical protein
LGVRQQMLLGIIDSNLEWRNKTFILYPPIKVQGHPLCLFKNKTKTKSTIAHQYINIIYTHHIAKKIIQIMCHIGARINDIL